MRRKIILLVAALALAFVMFSKGPMSPVQNATCAGAPGYITYTGYNAYPFYYYLNVRPDGYTCTYRVNYASPNCRVGMYYSYGYCFSGGGGGSW